MKTPCAPASILLASIVHALFSQRSCSVFWVYFCTVKCQTCSRLYTRSIPPSEYVCWVMNCNVFQVIMYLNSSRCYFNLLLFSLSLLQEPSLHPLLTSTSTDAQCCTFLHILPVFFSSWSIYQFPICRQSRRFFWGFFSRGGWFLLLPAEVFGDIALPRRVSNLFLQFFYHAFSLFLSIFSVSVSLYLCLSLLSSSYLTDTPVWHFTLIVFITLFLMGTNWQHTTVFLCFRSCLQFLFPSPSREKLETSSTSKLTRLS